MNPFHTNCRDEVFSHAFHALNNGHVDQAAVRSWLATDACDAGMIHDLLCTAASMGQLDVLTALLPAAAPRERQSAALRRAAAMGHRKCMALLWKASDPADAFLGALSRSSWKGVDALREAVGPEQWKQALDTAPPGALPGVLSDYQRHLLRHSLDVVRDLPAPPFTSARI